MRTPDDELDAVDELLWRVPEPPATAELADCIVPPTPARAAKNKKQTNKQTNNKRSKPKFKATISKRKKNTIKIKSDVCRFTFAEPSTSLANQVPAEKLGKTR